MFASLLHLSVTFRVWTARPANLISASVDGNWSLTVDLQASNDIAAELLGHVGCMAGRLHAAQPLHLRRLSQVSQGPDGAKEEKSTLTHLRFVGVKPPHSQ
jgi:hypothetical protein